MKISHALIDKNKVKILNLFVNFLIINLCFLDAAERLIFFFSKSLNLLRNAKERIMTKVFLLEIFTLINKILHIKEAIKQVD